MTLPLVAAEFNLEIEKIDKGSVVIKELRNPAMFDFIIKNTGDSENAEIYSLVGVSMAPKGTFLIPTGKSTTMVRAYLGEEFLKREERYSFEYQIKGQTSGIFKDQLNVQVVALADVFEIRPVNLHPDNEIVNIGIKNNVNSLIENVKITLHSEFFEVDQVISFKPFEKVDIPVKIDKTKITKLRAGPYPVKAEISLDKFSVEIEGAINYLEKEGTSVTKNTDGLIIERSTVKEVNEGNVPVTSTIEIKKDIVSRLFTAYSIQPLSSDRKGLFVEYTWKKDLPPGEAFNVVATTNYTFPFLFAIFVVAIALSVWFYSVTAIGLHKTVSFVRTKGGEFALRVRVRVRAKKQVTNAHISDRLPHMTKLYEKFDHKADKIDHNTGKLSWSINHLNKGEERTFSYIVYSKMQTVGRFELPQAMAAFDHEGKRHEVSSNKAFFVSEMHSQEA